MIKVLGAILSEDLNWHSYVVFVLSRVTHLILVKKTQKHKLTLKCCLFATKKIFSSIFNRWFHLMYKKIFLTIEVPLHCFYRVVIVEHKNKINRRMNDLLFLYPIKKASPQYRVHSLVYV